MVKVKNRYGDRYTGRMGLGIYQGRYGQQIRRRYTEKRKPRSELQKETEQRFKDGVRFAKSLTSQEIATLKEYIKNAGLRTTWYNLAKKAVMQRAEISYTVYESPEFYWELSVYHPLLAKIEIYNAEDELIYGEDRITDLKQGYIQNRRHLMGRQSIKRILIYSYSGKIYEEIVMVEDMSVYMRKDVYDVNDNGIVDNSEKLEGKTLDEIRAEMDGKILDHAAIADAHHTRYTDTEARASIDDLIDENGKLLKDLECEDHAIKNVKSIDGGGNAVVFHDNLNLGVNGSERQDLKIFSTITVLIDMFGLTTQAYILWEDIRIISLRRMVETLLSKLRTHLEQI